MRLLIQRKAIIQTGRLTLKPFSEQDEVRLCGLLTNREITKCFMVPDFESVEQATAFAKKLITLSQTDHAARLEYGIYLNGVLIGFMNDCGIEQDAIEIGYVIHPDFKGNGYATEAVRAMLNELREMGFKKVTAGYFTENLASRRVMEKCGMKQSDFVDEVEYRGMLHQCRYCEICF